MITQISPEDFLQFIGPVVTPQKHHFTGPPAYHQPENNGAVFYQEGQILATLAKNLGGDVLEVGTDLAISTRFISEGLDFHCGDGVIHTIDINQKWNFLTDWPRIIPFCCRSLDRAIRPYKWAFIDGDHREDGVKIDAKFAAACGCKHIIFHDTGDHHVRHPVAPTTGSDAREAVPASFDPAYWDIWDIKTGCGMMYVRQKGAKYE